MTESHERRAIYVAPHPDDVALSCGGAVTIAARTGAPIIVTVFAGQPTGELAAFAELQHVWWGVDSTSVTAQRRAEDECAARALGESVQPYWLDFLDAIYRNAAYDSDDTLFGKLQESDLSLIDQIAGQLADLGADEYVVPLGVGNHVDHQLVFRAGRRLARRGANVWAYADVPYALTPNALTPRLATGVVREVRLTSLDEDAFERKCVAIDCYTSQIPVIFRDHGDHRAALDRYHRHVGGGRSAEVMWRVMPS